MSQPHEKERCRLYVITPPQFDPITWIEVCKQAFDGGDIAALQLRMKEVPEDTIKQASELLLPLCHQYGTAFILNDNPELALSVGADGVHIGEEDGTAKEVRAKIGEDKILGVSCYGSTHRAMVAGEDGADYVAFGAFYPTTTKEPKARPEKELLKFWSEYTTVPCVAIGGITPANATPLIEAGADFIAVVSAIWNHPENPAAAVKAFNAVIDACQHCDAAS